MMFLLPFTYKRELLVATFFPFLSHPPPQTVSLWAENSPQLTSAQSKTLTKEKHVRFDIWSPSLPHESWLFGDLGAARGSGGSLQCSICPTISCLGHRVLPTPTPLRQMQVWSRLPAARLTWGEETEVKAEAWCLDRKRQTDQRHQQNFKGPAS